MSVYYILLFFVIITHRTPITTLSPYATIFRSKPLTRLSVTVASPRNLDHWLRHALTAMWAQPRGPVHLSLTHDAITGQNHAPYVNAPNYFAAVDPLNRNTATASINVIAQASRA